MRSPSLSLWSSASAAAFLFGLAGLLPAPARAEPPPSSTHTLELFYRWVLAHPGTSLPKAKDRAQLAPLLSPELNALLKEASDTEARCIKHARRDEKPLILEGDLFVGFDGGATEVAYGSTKSIENDTLHTTMTLFAIDKRFPKGTMSRTVSWVDNVQLRQQDRGMWRVHDVVFEQTRSLVKGLQAYIAEGAAACVPEKR